MEGLGCLGSEESLWVALCVCVCCFFFFFFFGGGGFRV